MIFVYDNSLKILDELGRSDIVSADKVEQLNNQWTIEVSIPYKKYNKLTDYLGFKYQDNFFIYKIISAKRENHLIHLTGIHLFFHELKGHVIRDRRFNNNSTEGIIHAVLDGTEWIYEIESSKSASTNFYHITNLEAFYQAIETLGVEFTLSMQYSGDGLIKKVIVKDFISRDKGKWYEYGDKLVSVIAEESHSNIFTAFIGRGKGLETDDGGYSRKLKFDNVEWKESNGNPIDKPLGQDYVEIKEATELYGFPNGKPRVAVIDFDEIEDAEKLIQATYNYAIEEARPKLQLKASAIDNETVEIGEIATVIRPDLDIRYKTRIFKVTTNLLNDVQSFEFGDRVVIGNVERLKIIQKQTDHNIADMYRVINLIRKSADGKSSVFSGPDRPIYANQNDIWYRQNADGTVDMLRFNDGEWEEILSDRVFEELRASIEENERIIAEAEERVNLKHGEIDGKQKELSDSILAFEEELDNIEGSISTRLTSVEGNYSQLTLVVNGIQSEVNNEINGIKSTQTQLSDLISTKVSSSDVSTIINQSYDSIYLGVQEKVKSEIDKNQMTGNEIKSAINLSTDGVDISGKFISITGETSISNGVIKTAHIGDAQITDAKIGNLTFNWAKGKTLNAEEVNLINLNANSMTTGTLSGTQGSWNLNSGLFRNGSTSNFETQLQYGTMTQYEGGVERLRLNPQGLQFFSKVGTGQHIGMMMSAEYKSTGKHGLTIGHSYPDNAPAFINIGYLNTTEFLNTGNRTYEPYILFDKWNSISDVGTAGYPIKVIERAEFRSQTLFDTSIDVNDYIKTGAWRWSAVTGLASAIGGTGFKIVDGLGYGFGFGANGTIWKVSAHSWTTKII